jgi:hypothetical protein
MRISEIVKAEMIDPTEGIAVMNESFGDDEEDGLEESFAVDPDKIHGLSLASMKKRRVCDAKNVLTTKDKRFLAARGYKVR